jgi:hypothetical protein
MHLLILNFNKGHNYVSITMFTMNLDDNNMFFIIAKAR